ncbi:enoyl-CoA hydratase-related protein [Pseudohoeflea coraliihabitans]|uniref:Enoyl-CoA hydratase/isomerase family protein n=1 Tax=Pseudohoeflea coraliihabitans TaxID=2860393 RepID=A0ABS6WTU6_9HYPH|nr:enoyl-CoA hydratase-related protein [Pseudohoeflea sp. DP4N28-3]MBW3099048.1 enoyl-CoA hydratase/isomerase family protein [Pseudohoeflea sp. DP4N28-3]
MSVTFTSKDHVARVTIDRPQRMNAIDAATAGELETIWQKIEADPSVRCVVLTGAGDRAFSAGADLKDETGVSGLDYWAAANPEGFGAIAFRRSLKVPVIARVNGVALGGGMEMVLGCDIVIAAESARFGLPEAKVGNLPLAGGMTLLQRLIPRNIAVGLMMTGRMASAQEMAHYGLVNAVVPADELDAETDRWVADILACAPLCLRAIKATVRDTAELPPDQAQAMRSPDLIAALVSDDSQEGVRAFREKRAPVWQGK